MTEPKKFTLEHLSQGVATGAALRLRRRLQPAGGPGDKVFPPTYEGGTYAKEDRIIDGAKVPCVLLDSVQSQANRMELALLAAQRAGRIPLPVIGVDFASQGLTEVGTITSLEAPHRIADAILRDSTDGGVKFRDGPTGTLLNSASTSDATGLFSVCPTALVFGLWDSTGPRGGLGIKFQRALVGELVAVNASLGAKVSSRIDPFNIPSNIEIYNAADESECEWTLDVAKAAKKGGKPVLFDRGRGDGKAGSAAKANHGNIPPTVALDKGGVTCMYALQTAVLSLPALRRLHFPVKGVTSPATDAAARTVLAAVGLCGAVLAVEQGLDLRSRCLLVPDISQPASWELVKGDGAVEAVTLTGPDVIALLNEAVKAAKAAGLPWKDAGVILTPSAGLVALVKKSRELALTATEGE